MSAESSPLLSVIVPVFNAGAYLRECVDSILCGQNVDFELILVNDGSTDGSAEICRSYDPDPRVRVIDIPNSGVSVARNTGIDAARAGWIVFCDADDRFYPGALDRMMAAATDEGAEVDMVVCGYDYTDVYREPEQGAIDVSVHSGRDALARILYQEQGWEVSPTKLFSRRLFDVLRFEPGRRFEDLLLIPKLVQASRKVMMINASLFFYRRHDGSFINSDSPGRCQAVSAVRSVADGIPLSWEECRRGARSRLFSAAFNTFAYASSRGLSDIADEAWKLILGLRSGVLRDRRVRAKNRIGAAISFLGRSVSKFICSWIYR